MAEDPPLRLHRCTCSLWLLTVREKTNIRSDSRRGKGRTWGNDRQTDRQRERKRTRESQETAGWRPWLIAKVCSFSFPQLGSLLPWYSQDALNRYKNVYFSTAHERKHLCKKVVYIYLLLQAPTVHENVHALIETRNEHRIQNPSYHPSHSRHRVHLWFYCRWICWKCLLITTWGHR